MAAYGGAYDAAPSTLTFTAGGTDQIPLASAMAASNVTNTPANSITIAEEGDYEINYLTNLSVTPESQMTFSVRQNGTDIPGTVETRQLAADDPETFRGDIIVHLNAGDVIDMALNSQAATTGTLADGLHSSLTVKMLDE